MFDPFGLRTRFRRIVEDLVPWFDRAQEDRERSRSRAIRQRAERTMALRNSYAEYGERVGR